MKFSHKKFFDGFKQDFDSSLDQDQVDGIEFLLTSFETNPLWKDIRCIAYALATIYHETATSMQPVEEGYYLGSAARVKAFQKTLRYYPYFGRGYVQLTWDSGSKRNYTKAGNALGLDLHNHPELALEKENAFPIMTLGMFQGWFTSKKLSDFIHGSTCDYVNARTIINGHDKAGLIAGYAKKFEHLLKISLADTQTPTDAGISAIPSGQLDAPEVSTATDSPANITPIAPVQTADTIVNTGDVATPTPPPQDVTLSAPQGMGSVSGATKVTIAGITIPTFLIGAVDAVKGWIADGYIDARQIGDVVLTFIQNNTKYIFMAIGGVIVVIIVKKICRELIFLVTVVSHAIPGWNSVTVVAPEPVVVTKKWWQFWK